MAGEYPGELRGSPSESSLRHSGTVGSTCNGVPENLLKPGEIFGLLLTGGSPLEVSDLTELALSGRRFGGEVARKEEERLGGAGEGGPCQNGSPTLGLVVIPSQLARLTILYRLVEGELF